MKSKVFSFGGRAILLVLAFLINFSSLLGYDDSTFVWKKLYLTPWGWSCGADLMYFSSTDSIIAYPYKFGTTFFNTMTGDTLVCFWNDPCCELPIRFIDNDRYFIQGRESQNGVYLYETKQVLSSRKLIWSGVITVDSTIEVNGYKGNWWLINYDISPSGKYALLEMKHERDFNPGGYYYFLFELPSRQLIKYFSIPSFSDTKLNFLTDTNIIVGFEWWWPAQVGYEVEENPRREYWIILYDINKEEVIDTIYSKVRPCPKKKHPGIPEPNQPCPPLGPTCRGMGEGSSSGGGAYCVPMFFPSRTGRYVLYGFVTQEWIDKDTLTPPLWYALYDVEERRVLWEKEFHPEVAYAGLGYFKFGPNDQYILLHGTHIIDTKTGDVVYIWNKENNTWQYFKYRNFDITKDGRYIASFSLELGQYLRRNLYQEMISSVVEEMKEGEGTIIPNPTDGVASPQVESSGKERVKITICNLAGATIRTIFEGALPEGKHLFEFQTMELAPGIYFVVVEKEGKVKAYKLVVTK
jgi:hypothetical protein